MWIYLTVEILVLVISILILGLKLLDAIGIQILPISNKATKISAYLAIISFILILITSFSGTKGFHSFKFLLINFIILIISGFVLYMQLASEEKSRKKITLTFGSIAALSITIFVVAILTPNPSAKSKPNPDNGLTDEEVAEQNKEDEKAAAKKDKQEKQEKSINSDITDLLNDDKKDASNGDTNYQYANYIQKIEYTNDSTKVYVNTDFVNLDDNTKNQVAEKVQGVIGAGVAMEKTDYKPADDHAGYSLYFWYGQRGIGHSKLSDSHQYKWYSN
ncbi:hypothetical protein MOO45_04930 [Bombilactobacillus folatiphilus]|uniref:Uncharacterized protein n=1 Tax=Bombilactobacillus folatiphilus TaxID=2923362 RepID=A0ABY4P7I2_9LACO|nr:hypothetical protein [Bombilactobacillus folatiphilus]UQS81569.1 hypothetical protein MOO45_04930 [Bombilactobacillus folatiphilus]